MRGVLYYAVSITHTPVSAVFYVDIVAGPVERPVAIIDAKYKPLAYPRGVDCEDLYQLNAYLSGHRTGNYHWEISPMCGSPSRPCRASGE